MDNETEQLLDLLRSPNPANERLFYAMQSQWTSRICSIMRTANNLFSENAKKLYLYILKNGETSKAKISEAFSHLYYHNASKYIGEILGRLVKSGQLFRVKTGIYTVNPDFKVLKPKTKINPNQTELLL